MLFIKKEVTKWTIKRLFYYKFNHQSLKFFIMKKSISFLSLALVMLGNVALASNVEINPSNASVYEVYDSTPLCVAVTKGDIDMVKQIISYGGNVDETTSRGMTPLMFAAIYNNSEIVNLLLEKGADLDKKDNEGFTALDHAKTRGSDAVVEILKQAKKKK